MPRAPPLEGHPEGKGGAVLLGGAQGGLSHVQALGSPVAVGQGWSSTGMWGTGCSWAALWGAEPSCQGLLRASPHSLLCGCWAQPPGLVKQQDRSRLGKRGTGESLNKRVFNLEQGQASVLFLASPLQCWAQHHAPPQQSPILGGLHPFSFPSSCSGHPFWGLGHPCMALGSACALIPLQSSG